MVDCEFPGDLTIFFSCCDRMKATSYTAFDYAAIEGLRVLPPLEPLDKTIQWARGSIRDADYNELIITGPRLPVLFAGRFNNVVFSIRGPGADDASHAFETFLHKILSHLEDVVSKTPDKFKPGLKNALLLQYDRDFIRPSSYGADLPNEFRVKVSIKRDQIDPSTGEIVEAVDSQFVLEDGTILPFEEITSGSEMVPIIRIGYYRNNNKFGLNMTLLKGLVYPGTKKRKTIDYSDLEFDV